MPRKAKHLRLREVHGIAKTQTTSFERTKNAPRSKTLTALRNAPNSKNKNYIFRTNKRISSLQLQRFHPAFVQTCCDCPFSPSCTIRGVDSKSFAGVISNVFVCVYCFWLFMCVFRYSKCCASCLPQMILPWSLVATLAQVYKTSLVLLCLLLRPKPQWVTFYQYASQDHHANQYNVKAHGRIGSMLVTNRAHVVAEWSGATSDKVNGARM